MFVAKKIYLNVLLFPKMVSHVPRKVNVLINYSSREIKMLISGRVMENPKFLLVSNNISSR